MFQFITAAAPSWSSLFTSFGTGFASAWDFIGEHDIFMVVMAVPVGLWLVSSVVKSVVK